MGGLTCMWWGSRQDHDSDIIMEVSICPSGIT